MTPEISIERPDPRPETIFRFPWDRLCVFLLELIVLPICAFLFMCFGQTPLFYTLLTKSFRAWLLKSLRVVHHRPEPGSEHKFRVLLGFEMNGVWNVAHQEELVSEAVYNRILLAERKNGGLEHNDDDSDDDTYLPHNIVQQHPGLFFSFIENPGHCLLFPEDPGLHLIGKTVQSSGQGQVYYREHFLCSSPLALFSPFHVFSLILINNIYITCGSMLLGILLASCLQYHWWKENLLNYQNADDFEMPVGNPTIPNAAAIIDDASECTSSTDTTTESLFGTVDPPKQFGSTRHATMDDLYGPIRAVSDDPETNDPLMSNV